MELVDLIFDYILYITGLLVFVLILYSVVPKILGKPKSVEEQKSVDIAKYKKLLRDRNSELQRRLAIDRIASERAFGSATSQSDLNISKIYFTRRSMVQQPARFQIINPGEEIETPINQ